MFNFGASGDSKFLKVSEVPGPVGVIMDFDVEVFEGVFSSWGARVWCIGTLHVNGHLGTISSLLGPLFGFGFVGGVASFGSIEAHHMPMRHWDPLRLTGLH